MGIIIAILIFSAIILFHEFGHFLLARLNGITVTEFSLGFGPRLWSVEKNGTIYSLKAFPLGGSCAMLGEDTDDDSPGSFFGASLPGKILVVAAGPVFNLLLAFFLAIIIVAMAGYDLPRVSSVTEGSHAYEAGLREGDIITSYNGYHVDLARDLYVYSYLNEMQPEDQIRLTVDREGEAVSLLFTPDMEERYLLGFNRTLDNPLVVSSLIPGYPLEDAGLEPGDKITGIDGTSFEDGEAFDAYLEEHPLSDKEVEITFVRNGLDYKVTVVPAVYRSAKAGFSYSTRYVRAQGPSIFKYALLEVKYMFRSTLLSLKELFTGGIGVEELSGPVGVVEVIGSTYTESKSQGAAVTLINLLSLAMLLSVNLGIMNLIPFPALDGGRLLFLFIEAVFRKPINKNIEGSFHFVGLILLMILMVFIMYSDVMKILR